MTSDKRVEKKLPKPKSLEDTHNLLFLRRLTRWRCEGYVLGLDRSRDNKYLLSHVYKGSYDELHTGMCKKSYDKYGGFSIFRNNITKGICKTCVKNTYKELIEKL